MGDVVSIRDRAIFTGAGHLDDLDMIAVYLMERAATTAAAGRRCRDEFNRPDLACQYQQHSAALYLEARIARDFPK